MSWIRAGGRVTPAVTTHADEKKPARAVTGIKEPGLGCISLHLGCSRAWQPCKPTSGNIVHPFAQRPHDSAMGRDEVMAVVGAPRTGARARKKGTWRHGASFGDKVAS